ncbi:MAG: hypothetical protein ACK4GM_16345 [Tabrizicola sp.]
MAPAMPWMGYAALTDGDAADIAAFLKSLPPVTNDVQGPFGPGEASGGFVLKVVAPAPQTRFGGAPLRVPVLSGTPWE